MSTDIVLHLVAALAYLLLGITIWLPLYHSHELVKTNYVRHIVLLAIIVIHGIAIHLSMLHPHYIEIDWDTSLSMTLWMVMIIFWLERLYAKIDGLLLPLTPLATIACLIAAFYVPHQHKPLLIPSEGGLFRLHITLSLFAYSLIAIAAIQSGLMAALDRYLHKVRSQHDTLWTRVIEAQPPLLTQEYLLTWSVSIGFIVLSLSILTGIFVSLKRTGLPLPFDHKTIFTLVSWLIFGILLLGRWLHGWRGRMALRWNLIGFAFLMIAYSGTKFAMDIFTR